MRVFVISISVIHMLLVSATTYPAGWGVIALIALAGAIATGTDRNLIKGDSVGVSYCTVRRETFSEKSKVLGIAGMLVVVVH